MGIEEGDWVLVDMDRWQADSAQSTYYGEGYKAEAEVVGIRPMVDETLSNRFKEYVLEIDKERYDHPGTNEKTKVLARRKHIERTYPTCKDCKSRKIHHDKKEEWICPFCNK